MKSIVVTLFLILIYIQPLFAMEKTLNWTFNHPKSGAEIVLGEKGSVQEGMIAAGLLPNPHIGQNEKEFDWIEEHVWSLKSTFDLSAKGLEEKFIDIELPSVDTYAKVYLNGILILTCENAFLPYRLTINQYVKAGTNELLVVFTPPVLYHEAAYKKAKYKLPAPNDVHPIAIAPYTRKPQYQFGWDWTFRMNTIGFNKPVKIVSYKRNKIINSSVQTLSITGDKAQLQFTIELAQTPADNMDWKSELFGELEYEISGKTLKVKVEVNQAKLWWPIHFGEQFLYSDQWELTTPLGRNIATQNKKFGIRTAELHQPKDQYGTAYEIVINGLKIFCKGGDYIPQEVFPAKVTDDAVRAVIEQMALANYNMVRVWGGGYYPDDVFFETCDEKGIMVWQDFMFACSMYPGTDEFLANVKQELDYHIPRMTSHPSVVLLNGNNEVEVAWNNWGFQLKYGLIGKSVKEIEKAYDDLFKTLIPTAVSEHSSVPYIHTSPLSNWGKSDYYNHGSQHYWGVWHGKDPIEDFGTKIGRFNSEYGFQSFPEYSTLSSVIEQKDWDLKSDVMKLRQKSYVGNEMIKKHADILYGQAPDFETFIYYSQLTQKRAVSMAIAGHRADWPRCAGTIYWQVNDCWPSPTWSSMDYFGNWKALHYEAKKDFENIAVVAVEKSKNDKEFFLIADWTKEYQTEVVFDFYDLNGNWMVQHSLKIDVAPQSVNLLPVFSLMDKTMQDYIVEVKWQNQHEEQFTRTFYNNISALPKSSSEAILQLENSENGTQSIIVTSDVPLINCWIYSKNKSFHLDRNFETLLPGRHVFQIMRGDQLTQEDLEFRTLN